MKLQPRERRPRSDYILDNAAALHLGRLYLGWGRSKAHSRPKRATLATQSKSNAAVAKAAKKTHIKTVSKSVSKSPRVPKKATPTPPLTPSEKEPANPATKATLVGKRSSGNPRKTPLPAVPVTGVAVKSKSGGNVAATTTGSASAKAPPKPLPRAPRKTPAVPTTKIVVQQRRRTNRNVPLVIPTPVPTPVLSLGEAEEGVDSGSVTVLVRAMNGTSFALACSCESTLYDLKCRILEIIMSWNASASPGSTSRLPMLVMNGRALGPEAASLAALRFSAKSTVYCFPEPN